MTEETRAKVENRVLQIAKLADEICESIYACTDCPLKYVSKCLMEDVCNVAVDIQKKRLDEKGLFGDEEPTYEDLPIDLDDEPKCADGCIYGWNSSECKTCDYYGWNSSECKTCDYKDDDYQCDSCGHPYQNDCFKKSDEDCPYALGECCEDNLATNVGRICFDHNVPTNFAMAIIEIIQKERDRNEYLHIYREHIPAE